MNRFAFAALAMIVPTAAFAQEGVPAGAPSGPMVLIAQFAPFLLVFAIMYFLMIRPQQQRQAELNKVQAGLSKGDRVLTQAGIYGTVVGVDGDKVVLRVDDNVKLEFQRSTIVGLAADKK
jgi:preprotein translocase subunit YajC